jgi:hypothetical protein
MLRQWIARVLLIAVIAFSADSLGTTFTAAFAVVVLIF